MTPITATLLTKNSEKYLDSVLSSLTAFDEVIIYDNGSTDRTLDIVRGYSNVIVHEGPFFGFGPTHNTASNLAKNEWIFSIDSDEVVSPELAKAIQTLQLKDDTVYSFPRDNYYNDKRIKWCGWYPDHQIRLYNRSKTRFTDAQVHEAVITDGMKVEKIDAPIIHYSYSCLSDFLNKMQSYSTLFAEQNCGKRESSPLKAISHAFYAFFKSYLLKRGFLGGYEGFIISAYNGHTAFYKYMKLYEANLKREK